MSDDDFNKTFQEIRRSDGVMSLGEYREEIWGLGPVEKA